MVAALHEKLDSMHCMKSWIACIATPIAKGFIVHWQLTVLIATGPKIRWLKLT